MVSNNILCLSDGGRISHYLVAMEFSKKKLTINGNNYYNNLPELVQVSHVNVM